MTGSTQLVMEVFAAGTVVGSPFIVIALARWAARGAAGRSVPVDQWLVPAVALLSGAAGLIHLLVIEEHMEASRLHAAMFAGLAAFQLLWAIWYVARPGRWLGWSAVWVNLGAAAVWLLSRTAGLPGWLDGGVVETVGLPDLASSVFELSLVAGLLALHWRPIRMRVADGRSVTRADAGLTMAMLSVAVVLVSLGAVASIASGAHTHAGGEDHARLVPGEPETVPRDA